MPKVKTEHVHNSSSHYASWRANLAIQEFIDERGHFSTTELVGVKGRLFCVDVNLAEVTKVVRKELMEVLLKKVKTRFINLNVSEVGKIVNKVYFEQRAKIREELITKKIKSGQLTGEGTVFPHNSVIFYPEPPSQE